MKEETPFDALPTIKVVGVVGLSSENGRREAATWHGLNPETATWDQITAAGSGPRKKIESTLNP